MTSTESERLRGLAAEWRARPHRSAVPYEIQLAGNINGLVEVIRIAVNHCADELEAALSDVPAPDANWEITQLKADIERMKGEYRQLLLDNKALSDKLVPAPLRKCSILYCFKPAFVETGFCEQHAVGGPAQPAPPKDAK